MSTSTAVVTAAGLNDRLCQPVSSGREPDYSLGFFSCVCSEIKIVLLKIISGMTWKEASPA